jgi:flavin reductase
MGVQARPDCLERDATDAAMLRSAARHFATGVTVVTTRGRAGIHGMTVNSFATVSLDPPLVLVCIARSARMHAQFVSGAALGVSVLAASQHDAAGHFADKSRPGGSAQFTGFPWHPGPVTGAALLNSALAWFDCTIEDTAPAGDHTIVVARVHSAVAADDGRSPLLFVRGMLSDIGCAGFPDVRGDEWRRPDLSGVPNGVIKE